MGKKKIRRGFEDVTGSIRRHVYKTAAIVDLTAKNE